MPTASLNQGVMEKLFDALTGTGDTKSSSYGVPRPNHGQDGRLVTWQTIFNGAPSAATYQLQGALEDIDAQYAVIDTSTATAGEMRHVGPVNVNFLRVRQVSRTGGTDVTVEVQVS